MPPPPSGYHRELINGEPILVNTAHPEFTYRVKPHHFRNGDMIDQHTSGIVCNRCFVNPTDVQWIITNQWLCIVCLEAWQGIGCFISASYD